MSAITCRHLLDKFSPVQHLEIAFTTFLLPSLVFFFRGLLFELLGISPPSSHPVYASYYAHAIMVLPNTLILILIPPTYLCSILCSCICDDIIHPAVHVLLLLQHCPQYWSLIQSVLHPEKQRSSFRALHSALVHIWSYYPTSWVAPDVAYQVHDLFTHSKSIE